MPMTTPAHFFGGYAVLRATEHFWGSKLLAQSTRGRLFWFGMFATIAVDLDVFYVGGIENHHSVVTHFPLFWLMVSAAIFFAGMYLKSITVQSFAKVLLVATWTHLALDLVGITMGVYVLWPFSMQEFSMTPLRNDFVSEHERLQYILSNPIVWIGDSVVVGIAVIRMLRDRLTRRKL